MRDSSEFENGLSPQRRALLQLLREEKNREVSRGQVIPHRPQAEFYPLSFAQERMWFLNQLEPESPFYNVPGAVHLTGVLDVKALEGSLGEVCARHEALRTTFAEVAGEPVQRIHAPQPFTLPLIDLGELPHAERQAVAAETARREGQQSFDLTTGPLLRAVVLRLAEAEHLLLLTMHHIVSDGWSTKILVNELAAIYQAFSAGEPSPLPTVPIQYADFAVWQRRWLEGETLSAQTDYWREQLGRRPQTLEIPTDRPRPAVQTYRGATHAFLLPPELRAVLRALSREEGVTNFMILLAAFKALLQHYTGQAEIVVGSPIAGRNREQLEGLIGFFANTLVPRTNLSGDPTVRELLGRVRDVALGAYAHQDLPFAKFVVALQPQRDLSRTPLFQIMFATQTPPEETLELPNLRLRFVGSESVSSKFDLSLDIIEGTDVFSGLIEYSTDLFDAATIESIGRHYCTLLAAAVANPELRLSNLPLLDERERGLELFLEEEIAFNFD